MTKKGRLMALDVGTKTIGVAKCDELRMLASPHSTLSRKSVKIDSQALAVIAQELEIVGLVVGLPLSLDGSENRSVKLAKQVGDALAQILSLPLIYHDERFSSVEAEKKLIEQNRSRKKRKQTIDQSAACVILQDFIDSSESNGFAIGE